MTDDNASRNDKSWGSQQVCEPSGASTVPQTLLELKTATKTLGLRPQMESDIVSAINTIGRGALMRDRRDGAHQDPPMEQIDEALARISTNAKFLLPHFDRRIGALLGLTKESWRNIPWRIKYALRLTGAWELFNAPNIPLNSEWQPVAELLPKYSYVRVLGRWGTVMNVSPSDLAEHHLPQFHQWLLTWKSPHYARRCYRTATNEWNRGASTIPSWPGQLLNIDSRLTGHYSVPTDLWPLVLLDEVERVLEQLRYPDVDDEGQEDTDPKSEGSIRNYRSRLMRTLSAYVAVTKVCPATVTSLLVILKPENAKLAFEFMIAWTRRRKPDATKTTDVHSCAKLLANIAANCYRHEVSGDTVLRLQKMARNRAPTRRGMTPKNKETRQLFEDKTLQQKFLTAPFEIAAQILKRDSLRRVDEVRLMLAFAWAQSIEAPLRPGDQGALIIGQHIYAVDTGRQRALVIRTTAQKTQADLEFELSGPIVQLYEDYLRLGRTHLCDKKNPHLYPGPGLGPKFRGSLSMQLARFIEDEIGVRLTGQQFRHVIGYLYLKAQPGDYETVRQLLGHKDISTTMLFYAAMGMREASKKVSGFIGQLRDELTPLTRRRRGTQRKLDV